MFSRIASELHGQTNRLYRLRAELEAQGHQILDLVSGNVTENGILFPQHLLEEILIEAAREAQVYRPDSFGRMSAREAVASYYQQQGLTNISPADILLTPGTSISYWYCFKLLANEGDEILCPRPSYPLFDYIAALSGVRMVSYRLNEARGWAIDFDRLEVCVSTKTRAIVLISPHNPTGHIASSEEIERLAGFARRHRLALISDEVFSEFRFHSSAFPRPANSQAPLVFTLNGFSKMFALPGLKLGWMAVSGEEERVRPALRALELISDTFLPVNEIVQAATPAIFERGREFRDFYARAICARWGAAREILRACSRVEMAEPEGGFYVTLRLMDLDEERAAEEVLRKNHFLVHPGHFYDIDPDHLVLSFIHEPQFLEKCLSLVTSTLRSI